MNLLEYTMNQTSAFLASMPKGLRKKKGQFFTSIDTAKFMSEMFDFSDCGNEVSGSGCGDGDSYGSFY